MKPFSLDTVLKFRQQRVDKAATRLASAQLELQKVITTQKSINRELQEVAHRFEAQKKEGISPEDLILYQDRLEWLTQELERISSEVALKRQKVEVERNMVIARSREKTVLDKLKEKQNKAYREYREKKETNQLDEIGVLSHSRHNTK